MTFLLTNWRTLSVIALFVIYSSFIYRIGGNSPRAELARIEAAAKAYQQESARIAKEKDRAYEKDLARVKSDWDAYRLRNKRDKAVNIRASVCESDEANRELSDALSAYVGEVERFRTGAEGLLAEADGQREQLICATEWADTLNR